MGTLINLDSTQRGFIASRLREYVEAGMSALGEMPDGWWRDCERFYRNEPPGGADILGRNPQHNQYCKFHFALSQPRLDMLSAQVCTVVGKQDPYMRDVRDEADVADAKETLLYRIWKDGDFESKIRDASTITGNTDLAFYRLTPGEEPGTVRWDVLHPRNVIVVPPFKDGIQKAACVGHKYSRRRAEVDSMRAEGLYYEGIDLTAGDPADTGDPEDVRRSGAILEGMPVASDRQQDLPTLWELVVRLALNGKGELDPKVPEKKYLATFSEDDNELLCLEEYKAPLTWYFRTFFVGNPTEFYSSSSVGRNLYALQDAYNMVMSGIYSGSMMSAMKPMIGPKLGTGEKYATFPMGSYVQTDSTQGAYSPTINFAGQPLFELSQKIESTADQVARISQNTQGSQAQGQTTATEQSIIAAGVAVGVEEYIANFTSELPMAAKLTMWFVDDQYDAFAERYGDELEDLDPVDVAKAMPTFMMPPNPIAPPMALPPGLPAGNPPPDMGGPQGLPPLGPPGFGAPPPGLPPIPPEVADRAFPQTPGQP